METLSTFLQFFVAYFFTLQDPVRDNYSMNLTPADIIVIVLIALVIVVHTVL